MSCLLLSSLSWVMAVTTVAVGAAATQSSQQLQFTGIIQDVFLPVLFIF